VVLGSDGHMVKIDYSGRRLRTGDWGYVWFNPVIGSLGPERKVGLLRLLEDSGSNRSFDGDAVFVELFGRRRGSILGDKKSLNSARRFVEAIPASGDDRWHQAAED
jgi:hypothetical protein